MLNFIEKYKLQNGKYKFSEKTSFIFHFSICNDV